MFKILLVDDEPIIKIGVRKLLEGTDYIIAGTASNGSEALLFLETNSVDIILTDLKMPVMDGIELIRQLDVYKRHGSGWEWKILALLLLFYRTQASGFSSKHSCQHKTDIIKLIAACRERQNRGSSTGILWRESESVYDFGQYTCIWTAGRRQSCFSLSVNTGSAKSYSRGDEL